MRFNPARFSGNPVKIAAFLGAIMEKILELLAEAKKLIDQRTALAENVPDSHYSLAERNVWQDYQAALAEIVDKLGKHVDNVRCEQAILDEATRRELSEHKYRPLSRALRGGRHEQ